MLPALLGLICVATSGVILIALHFLPTGLDPIRYAVSDYGWTAYHLGYRAMVVLQGAGAILIAVGLGQETDVQALGWLYVYGAVRALISGFMTDREPEGMFSLTRTGRIHVLLAGTAFASIAVAASHLDRRTRSSSRHRAALSRCGASPGERAGRRATRRDPCCA